jgi:23S rRNA (adenine2503-C2)-methyltransferase
VNILNVSYVELEDIIISLGYKKYNASQVFDWVYRKRIKDFNLMSNVKKKLIDYLSNNYSLRSLKIKEVQEGDSVYKFLFELTDNSYIEAVLMKQSYGNSLCISTQVGCNMGCKFCESGKLKKQRNLEVYEMLEQIILVEEYLNIKLTHLVLMGIGEPFDNYDNVMKMISILNRPKGINLGSRHITISTCGIVPKIIEFSTEPYQVNLAISLHASNDKLRDKLMPINKVYNLDKLIDSIKYYINNTNRRVTIEYIMLKGVNDTVDNAKELVKLLKGMNVYVNLIPYNETDSNFKRSSNENVMKFYDILKKNKINVTVRKEFGGNLDAACGQLSSIFEEDL